MGMTPRLSLVLVPISSPRDLDSEIRDIGLIPVVVVTCLGIAAAAVFPAGASSCYMHAVNTCLC